MTKSIHKRTLPHQHTTQTNSSHSSVPFSQCSLWCKHEETSTPRITVQYAVPSFKAAGLLPVSHAAVQHSWIKQPPAPHCLWLDKLGLPSQYQSNHSYISTRAEVIQDDFAGNIVQLSHKMIWMCFCFFFSLKFSEDRVIWLVSWYEGTFLWDVKCQMREFSLESAKNSCYARQFTDHVVDRYRICICVAYEINAIRILLLLLNKWIWWASNPVYLIFNNSIRPAFLNPFWGIISEW